MNCNCNNKNNSMKEAKIKHVLGNVLRIAIPLTLRTVELVDVDVDGEIEQQAQVTDTDFIPSSDYPVNVVFNKGAVKVSLKAQMRDGNIAYVEDKGKISVGTYDITVTCNDNDGNPYRFKQNTILQVVDATADAGIATPIEYEVTTWYLDAAIYLVMKGEDGVGIEDIITESSGEIGGVNTVTFVLTNGETRSFTILNGSGSVDSDFDENSLHPISNSVITNKFKSIDANISGLFGDVDYDSSSKILRFWDITKSTILATVDARPFVKDGMVNRVYIQNRTLVITFNTDSGHDTIAISLDSVFNPNNYYTRVQTDNRIADEISSASSGLMTKAEYVNEDSNNIKYSSAPEIVLSHIEGVSIMEESHSRLFGTSDGHIKGYAGATGSQLYDYGLAPDGLVFLDKTSGLFYRWDYTTWQQVGGSSGGYEPPIGGIPKTDLAQSVQDTLDDVSNKVDKVAGKGLSTEDYTTAEKQKLAGLSNYDDTEIQAEVDAKYEKPNTGIPKTDLAQPVQDTLDAVADKVDKETGKSLMTDAERTKLQGIAAGAEVNVQPNWTQTNTSADDYIKNKPTLATVATSGSYNDLQDKPTIPAAYDDTTLSGRVSALENAGFITTETDPNVPSWAKQQTKPTYTAQEVGALPASTTIPTKTSDLTNDSGFIDKAMYYGESTTAAATMPKVCTVETFPTYTNNGVTHAKEGTIIAVKFTNSDTNTTDAPSLNVNGIGAKAIMYNNAIVTSTAKNTTVAGTAKMLAYYRYDPALDEGNGAWEFLAKSVDSNSTYSNASLGQGYGTQTNSSAATAITSSISSYALSSGGIVTIKFTYDVPANATLNINSKGAKAIYNQGSPITAGVIKAGDTATFIYSTYYYLLSVDSWQDKQDTISDLATIRSGAAAGATAAQPADIPTKVSDLTNDSGFTSNVGTITGITMNGASKGTSGVVDLGTVITAHQDISGKANASEVYTKTQTDTLLSGKQNTLTFDTTPTDGHTTQVMSSDAIKTALDEKADADSVPTKTEMADAIDDALGEAQVTVVPEGSVGVISSLGSDSDSDALSASMGKKLKVAIITVLNSLGNYAFPDGKPVIDWGDDTPVTYTVSKTIGTGLSATGGDTDVEMGDSLEVTIAVTNNMYTVDDDSVVVTMGGSPVAGAWNASTMKVTIAAVYGDVVINVPSMTYEQTNLAFQLDCMNGVTKSGSTPTKWTDLIGNKEFVLTNVTEAQGGGMSFDGSSSTAVCSNGSLNVGYKNGTIEFVLGADISLSGFNAILYNGQDGGICAIGQVFTNTKLISTAYSSTAISDAKSLKTNGNFPKAASILVNENGTITALVNGEKAQSGDIVSTNSNYLVPGDGGGLGKMGVGTFFSHTDGSPAINRLFAVTIRAIRVYGTHLTLQQAQKNYKIDKKRFNLA